MEPKLSVHDNDVYGYTVDCRQRRLTLYTEYFDGNKHELTDVIFAGVVAHHFENVLSGNVLFDVEEVATKVLISENAELLLESWRYGWPPVEYDGNLDLLEAALQAASIRAFAIRSSHGLSGWVLAASCVRTPRAKKAQL
jgi:hypothetical protein